LRQEDGSGNLQFIMNRRRAGRNTALFFIALSIGPVFVAACADPKGEFDEYIDRTNNIRGVIPEGGVVTEDTGATDTAEDVPPFDANVDVSGTFFASCLPTLAGGNAAQSLLFYMEVTEVSHSLALNIYPLSKTATTFSKSETVGVPQVIPMAAVNADGTWKVTVGEVDIPGTSQRISDNDLTLVNVSYDARITSVDRMCAELSGKLTKPFESSIDGPGDICIFNRMAEGTMLPVVTQGAKSWIGYSAADHHCP
jgi:hypothetical protein